jgi:hypothetical protein
MAAVQGHLFDVDEPVGVASGHFRHLAAFFCALAWREHDATAEPFRCRHHCQKQLIQILD